MSKNRNKNKNQAQSRPAAPASLPTPRPPILTPASPPAAQQSVPIPPVDSVGTRQEEALKDIRAQLEEARKELETQKLRRQDIAQLETETLERRLELEAAQEAMAAKAKALEARETAMDERLNALQQLEAAALDGFRSQEAEVRQAWFEQRTRETEAALAALTVQTEAMLEQKQAEAAEALERLQLDAVSEQQQAIDRSREILRQAQRDADSLLEEAQSAAQEHQKRSREQAIQTIEAWQSHLHAREDTLRTREQALEAQNDDVLFRERQVKRREVALEDDESYVSGERKRLKEREDILRRREEACSGATLGRLEAEKELLEQKLRVYVDENLKLRETLEARNRLLESGSPEQLLQENSRLREELNRHLNRLTDLPTELELAQLRREAQAGIELEARCRDLEAQLTMRERERRNRDCERLETEGLRRERDTLRLINEHLSGEKEDLERLLGELKSKKGDVFANFTLMVAEDTDDSANRNAGRDLKLLTEQARAWMWHLPTRQQLEAGSGQGSLFAHYYDAHTLRAFVASLAASRLLILQGVSGTGKTSLPEYFAHAIGGSMTRVEVQSSWRDRPDLMGFYNAFYRQFNESTFARALFEAGTRKHRNRPYFIVLDEANLSRIEYYFADILSIMEGRPEDRAIELLNHDPTGGHLPDGLRSHNGAVRLPIPPNVWFICTANTDESTYEITRKVYDRAQVLQLDHTPEAGQEIPQVNGTSPLQVGLNPFLQGVHEAVAGYPTPEREQVLGALEKVGNGLRQHFGVHYGQRLLDQLQVFLPVYKRTGGTSSDGLDHFIARKLLWQLINRTDPNVRKGLENMHEIVQEAFSTAKLRNPQRCLDMLSHEIDRFRR